MIEKETLKVRFLYKLVRIAPEWFRVGDPTLVVRLISNQSAQYASPLGCLHYGCKAL